MASAATLKVDFLGDLNDLTKKFRSATTQMESFANRINRIGKQMSVALTAPITAFAGVSVRAFAKQEDAERKLASAIRATGGRGRCEYGTVHGLRNRNATAYGRGR
jgi:hypothetical protein